MLAAHETIIRLVEIIEIIGEVAHRHKTFALVLVKLDIESPFGNARNYTGKYLSETVVHVFDLLVLDGCALGIGGKLLHVGRVLALFLELLYIHASATCEIALKKAVYHHVRIAADGRSKVGVVVETETIVADVRSGINSFCHGADSKCGKEILLTFTLDIHKHTVD